MLLQCINNLNLHAYIYLNILGSISLALSSRELLFFSTFICKAALKPYLLCKAQYKYIQLSWNWKKINIQLKKSGSYEFLNENRARCTEIVFYLSLSLDPNYKAALGRQYLMFNIRDMQRLFYT